MRETHISADELARRTGIPASSIKKIRNNNNPNPTLTTLIPLAEYFDISLDQFVGKEPIPDTRIPGQYKNNIEKLKRIPIIRWKDAIIWPNVQNKDEYPKVTSEFDYSTGAYALLVEESEWENLSKGTALLVEPNLKPEHRDFVIIHKKGHIVPTVKQILHDEDQIYLKPIIAGYNITLFSDEHRILGVIVEYKKHLKKLS